MNSPLLHVVQAKIFSRGTLKHDTYALLSVFRTETGAGSLLVESVLASVGCPAIGACWNITMLIHRQDVDHTDTVGFCSWGAFIFDSEAGVTLFTFCSNSETLNR